MEIMKRWLFNILAALSLLVFMATVALWVRTYWYSDQLTKSWNVNDKYYLLMPYWAFCLLELVLPARWLFRRLRSRQSANQNFQEH